LFAALLSSRPYPHYLLQTIPSLSFSFGLLIEKNKERFIFLFFSFCLLFSFLHFNFWHYPNTSYYLNFYQFVLRQKSRENYSDYFGRETKYLYQIAQYLNSHTSPQERIFVWGDQSPIYALAERLPASRYFTAYHIIDFNGHQEVIASLTKNRPPYIVINDKEKRAFRELFLFIRDNYLPACAFDIFTIFELKK